VPTELKTAPPAALEFFRGPIFFKSVDCCLALQSVACQFRKSALLAARSALPSMSGSRCLKRANSGLFLVGQYQSKLPVRSLD
jgi:hypothetical protein